MTDSQSMPDGDAEKGRGVLIVDLSHGWGGAQASLCDWLEASSETFRANARALVANKALSERLSKLGCRVEFVRIGHWRRSFIGLLTFLRDWAKLRSMIADCAKGMDAIYLNAVRSGLPLIGLSRSRTPRVVVHFRDVRGSRLADRLVAGRADACVATTNFQKGMMTPRIGGAVERLTVVANGVATPVLGERQVVRQKLAIPEDAKLILLAADYVAWKRHERLLGALALLPGWHAVICGGPRDGRGQRLRRDLETLSRTLRVDARAHFAGRMDIGEALAAADVLVSLADDEPFGRTVVEAMQVGKPVVAMTRGGPAELLEGYDGGYRLADDEIPYITAALREAVTLTPSARNDWAPADCARQLRALLQD